MIYPRATALALIVRTDEVLLLRMREDACEYWAPPGGGLRSGETLPRAAAREAREEAGLDVLIGGLLYVHDFINPADGCHKVEVYFRATPSGDPTPRSTPDRDPRIVEARWVRLADVAELALFPPQLAGLMRADLRPGASPQPRYF